MFLKMYLFFIFFLNLASMLTAMACSPSFIQHSPDLNETKWSNESWTHTVVMQPRQVGCMTAVE